MRTFTVVVLCPNPPEGMTIDDTTFVEHVEAPAQHKAAEVAKAKVRADLGAPGLDLRLVATFAGRQRVRESECAFITVERRQVAKKAVA